MDSDDDQRNERLDMDNDYEGGEFIGGEFFFGKKKEKRKWTKEDSLYGVFGDSDDEEGGRGGRRKGGRGEGGGKQDFTAPVSFVSGGVKAGEALSDQVMTGQSGAGAGLGAGGGGAGAGGIGFAPATTTMDMDQDDDEEEVLPTAFGQRLKEQARSRQKQEKSRQVKEKEKKKLLDKSSDIGTFEKHTKGIGMKLLQKMGWSGGGMGAEGTGMAKAVETKLRPKNMGMGFNDFREAGSRHEEDEAPKEAKAARGGGAVQDIKMWKKKNTEVRKKRVYKTASEILESAADEPLVEKQTIIDMRGPQSRVVTNLEHLNVMAEAEGGEPTPMPELQHNLRLIVDLAEADLQGVARKLRMEKDSTVLLGREEARLEEEVQIQANSMQRLAELTSAVKECQREAGDASVPMSQLAATYQKLRANYREEYSMYSLGDLAFHMVRDRVAKLFAGWAPLMNPSHGREDLQAWRGILEKENMSFALYPDVSADDDPFVRLLWDVVLPPVRQAVTNQWEPRQPEALLVFLEKWDSVLPPVVRDHILDQLVLPKLKSAVDHWEPRSETIPIHAWVHPWLPLLKEKLEPLFAPIRYKLGSALQAWHPSDASALAILAPWHTVLERKEWDQLLVRSILPKLAFALQELVINPQSQVLDPFQWVMRWHEVVAPHHMAALLEAGFFPKWHQVLWQWLQHSPNYDEITRWYLGWKGQLPEDVQANERVRTQLNAALNMMNQAVEGGAMPAPPGAAAGGAWGGGAAAAAPPPPVEAPPPLPHDDGEMTLKAAVERFAEESGVEFLPRVGRMHEGMQMYSFGKVSVVVDVSQQMILAYSKDRWVPMSMQGLLQEHHSRAK